MRIIIEIDGAGSDAVRVASATASAVPPEAFAPAAAPGASLLMGTNAGAAPSRGGGAAVAIDTEMAAANQGAAHSAGTSAGAAPGNV